MNTCSHGSCPNKPRISGLCDKHHTASDYHGWLDATATKEQLHRLHNAGWTWEAIAEEAGLTSNGIYYLRDGARHVRAFTAKIIQDIPLDGGSGLVPAIGLRRRIEALAVNGWSQAECARRIGVKRWLLWQWANGERVQLRNARLVYKLFDDLCMKQGPSQRTRRLAIEAGWLPPLAWDDIDDPNETPVLTEQPATFLDRYLDMRDTLQLTDPQIAERMGIKFESLITNLRRLEKRSA
ncbi:hypothetical protein SAMN04488581_2650 [Mycolicibacterium neoaurum]|uniref:DNA-binding protein n=1 Tax=Mycolicibacterium neoaurum TaxID=1795 RepID=UPI0008918E69|nr:DNA-binding protein [Mycolicibacterium neoaurum]SDD60675.1 hypothetical protein SAMN04488581_2650 [Mycolicibacterium neoaurum]